MNIKLCCDIKEELINDIIKEVRKSTPKEIILFDFTEVGFVSLYSMTFFVLFINWFINYRNVLLLFSKKSPILYYFSRMGFFINLDSRVCVDPPESRQPKFIEKYRWSKETILEITPVNNMDIDRTILHIYNTMKNTLKHGEAVAEIISVLVSELISNVNDHSSETNNCYISLQAYQKGSYAELAVVDTGIGIINSLKRNERLRIKDDINALVMALNRGVSQFKDQNRGVGLHTCLELTRIHGGSFYFRSRKGELFFKNNKYYTSMVHFFPGTQINIKIPYENFEM